MTMEFWIALGAAVLGAASLLLHFIAPRTKTMTVLASILFAWIGLEALLAHRARRR
jgi:hypothetical protein